MGLRGLKPELLDLRDAIKDMYSHLQRQMGDLAPKKDTCERFDEVNRRHEKTVADWRAQFEAQSTSVLQRAELVEQKAGETG